MIEFVVAFGM